MRYFNMELNFEEIITKVSIDLPHGVVNEVLLSEQIYRQKNWYSRLLHFDEIASGLCIDLFTQALNKLDINNIEVFLFNKNKIDYIATTNVNNETIEDIFLLRHMETILMNDVDKVAEVIASYIIITNRDFNFVIIIDEDREFYYFYGDKSFINDIFPFTFDGYKSYYDKLYHFAKDNFEYLKADYLKWFWKTYLSIVA